MQDAIFRKVRVLQLEGPSAERPAVDTLKGSYFDSMKELRASEAWRVAFAFGSKREAILLVAASKKGVSSKPFYRRLMRIADERFARHLAGLEQKD